MKLVIICLSIVCIASAAEDDFYNKCKETVSTCSAAAGAPRVCVTNGINTVWFRDRCAVDYVNCQAKMIGRLVYRSVDYNLCDADEAENCPKFCFRHYSPVCATDGSENRTFPNVCMFAARNCNSGRAWAITELGTCKASIM